MTNKHRNATSKGVQRTYLSQNMYHQVISLSKIMSRSIITNNVTSHQVWVFVPDIVLEVILTTKTNMFQNDVQPPSKLRKDRF